MRCLIIGGGIGGSTLAHSLCRFGYDVEVFEAYPRVDEEVGYFLNLASNGIHGLRQMELWRPEILDPHRMPTMVFRSGRGKRLGEVANGIIDDDGTTSVTVKRNRLHWMLVDAAEEAGALFHYDKRATSVEENHHGVTVTFEDGSTARGDLAIGADGVHSAVRKFIDPDAPAPSYTGILSVAGYVAESSFSPTPDEMQMLFGRRAFFGHLVRDDGEVYWFANIAVAEERHAEFGKFDKGQWQDHLRELFEPDDPVVVEMIAATTSEIGAFPIYDLRSTPQWHRGRLALLGDAAHATSPNAGQGASLAIEDAMSLARCLRDLSNYEVAFDAYEGLRRKRAEKVVAYSRKLGTKKAIPSMAAWFRDLFMPLALKLFANSSPHDWIYSYRPVWEEKITENAIARG